MGKPDDLRQGELIPLPIVAFDFDGTLTVKDSYTAFLAWRAGPMAYGVGVVRLIPAGLAYLAHRDRGRLKAAATAQFLAGVSRNEIEDAARKFADAAAPRLFRPDAVRAWERWRAAGAELVIVTASPEEIVAPFARRLGTCRLIGTRLAFDAAGLATGDFEGANCRGPEKVRRLREVFGDDLQLAAAYGDTGGDTEMLALARDKGFKVFRETS